jgi:exocyst complex component 7
VIVTHIGTLNTLSKTGRRPQMGSIYLLNNISHIRNQLLDPPDSTIDEFLSKPTQDILNSNFRTARAAYFDSNFSPLIQALADEKERSGGLVGGGKSAIIKEKWSRFFDALDEVAERHRVARVLADDPEGRTTLQDEVVRLVIPALLRFTQKNKEKEFSKREWRFSQGSICTLTKSCHLHFRPGEV